ncbi:DUF3558 domain-containing protein [Umezawaea tangerina]|uniref:Uncharacterized protein DUF3558 n=1 Tax=Umezawaea tangerina TaxID=84725 RepID=A0A2T0TEC5_9PSEU|nr:DUF3558 domain-containing protein [Umezawaea tangerina]PRY44001.1 uncharacterized protein DUF3558 [Umezawaea tangerina]
MRTLLLLTALTTLAFATAGCGDSPSTPAAAADGLGDTTQHGAPRVASPMVFANSAKKPCGLLTEPQLKTLGMPGVEGVAGAGDTGPMCDWDDTPGTSGQRVSFTFTKGNGNGGLDRVYELKSTFKLFELQAPIQDYPTLLNAPTDDRLKGVCTLVVGITDDQILTTTIQMRTTPKPAPRAFEPCVVAREAADLALTSIRTAG